MKYIRPKRPSEAAGVRKVWVFRAFDDSNEVFILQELDSERHARSWIPRHHTSADWMEHGGGGVYPPLFVGKLVRMIKVEDQLTGPRGRFCSAAAMASVSRSSGRTRH